MSRVRRSLRALRLELALALVAYAGLLAMAHPGGATNLFDLPSMLWTHRLFAIGLVVAIVALGVLAVRLWGRLIATGRRRWMVGENRAATGTVITEFALVMPVVLLVMSMIVELALIANASLVVRYAAFAAARSAIVNLDSAPWAMQPAPEWVQMDEPERAARLVLTSLSPKGGAATGVSSQLESLLRAQPEGTWQGREFANRWDYARQATTVENLRDKHGALKALGESYSGMIPDGEHMVPPHSIAAGGRNFDVAVIGASTISGKLVPSKIDIPIKVKPIKFKIRGIPVVIPVQPPIPTKISVPIPKQFTDPIKKKIDSIIQPTLNVLATGNAGTLDGFTKTPLNTDLFSPKEVEITVAYDFLLTLPSLHFVPGITLENAPVGPGKAFRIEHTVRLQSTGGRRANVSYVFLAIPQFRAGLKKIGLESGWLLYW